MFFADYAKDWLDKPPYITHVKHGDWSGNAILETAQYFWIKDIFDGLDGKDRLKLWDVYNDAGAGEPGLLTRGSHKAKDPQTHDDYVGFSSIAGRIDTVLAWRVYKYGDSHKWNYKLPWLSGFRDWFNGQFWRMPGVVQTIKMGADEPLTWWDQFWLFIGLVGGVFSSSDSTSGRLMDWCVVKLYEYKKLNYPLPNLGIRLWRWDIRRRYPNLMGDVFGIYYGKDHLFAIWMQGVLTRR